MARPGKLKTRKSTLGATRDERISSAMDSLAATSVYDSRKAQSKSYQRPPVIRRIGGIMVEQRDEQVPSSIQMEPLINERSPSLLNNSTFRADQRPPSPMRTSSIVMQIPGANTRSESRSGSRPRSRPRSTNERLPSLLNNSTFRVDQRPPSPMRTSSIVRQIPGAATRSESRSGSRPRSRPRSMPNSPFRILRKSVPDLPLPLLSSLILTSTTRTPCEPFEECIELVSMKNEQDQPFVRILVSKTSYKPRVEDGVEVIARLNQVKAVADQRAKRKDRKNIAENGNKDQGKVAGTIASRETSALRAKQSMPPILKTMDTTELSMCNSLKDMDSAIKVVSACSGLESSSLSGKQTISRNKSNVTNVIRVPIPDWEEEDRRDDINAPNYYGIHSLKTNPRSLSRGRLFSFKHDDLADNTAKKEPEKREKIQKKIQKRLGKKAKKQIQNEIYIGGLKSSDTFNSAAREKINFVTRSKSDDKIYNQSWDDTFPMMVNKNPKSSSNQGFLKKIRASFSMEDNVVPGIVSFVSSAEGDIEYMNCRTISRDTAEMQVAIERTQGKPIVGAMSGIGNVFGFGNAESQDVRDMRMVESDLSCSVGENEDDCSESSLSYYY